MSILCRLGIHTSLYVDSALHSRVERCNKCNKSVSSKMEQQLLTKERELWGEAPKELDTDQRIGWVFTRLMEYRASL